MLPTIFSTAGLGLLLADLKAGKLATLKAYLFINDVDPGKTAVIGSFTPATFTGSTPLAVSAWNTSFVNPAGDAECIDAVKQWNWTAGAAETVYGIYFTDGALISEAFLGYARLDAPKLMAAVGNAIAMVPTMIMSALGFGAMPQVA